MGHLGALSAVEPGGWVDDDSRQRRQAAARLDFATTRYPWEVPSVLDSAAAAEPHGRCEAEPPRAATGKVSNGLKEPLALRSLWPVSVGKMKEGRAISIGWLHTRVFQGVSLLVGLSRPRRCWAVDSRRRGRLKYRGVGWLRDCGTGGRRRSLLPEFWRPPPPPPQRSRQPPRPHGREPELRDVFPFICVAICVESGSYHLQSRRADHSEGGRLRTTPVLVKPASVLARPRPPNSVSLATTTPFPAASCSDHHLGSFVPARQP